MADWLSDHGIEMVVGMPGSGKSFFLVERGLAFVRSRGHRRPVYTNLPIRWRVMRAYLRNRDGEEVAGLFRRLSLDHFVRFLKRNAEFGRLLEQRRAERGDALRIDAVEREFFAKRGPHVTQDRPELCWADHMRKANWIAPYSVLILDEVQLWFSMRDQGDDLDGLLYEYLSMHRHHNHLIYLATQHGSEASISFRKQLVRVWRVYNRRDDKFLWGLKFAMLAKWLGPLGVAFGYQLFDRAAYERGLDRPGVEPVTTYTRFPLIQKPYIFRLYQSFSRAGSPLRMTEVLRQVRREAGLDESGRTPRERQKEDRMAKRQRSKVWRTILWWFKWGRRVTVCGIVLALGIWIGVSAAERDPLPAPDVSALEGKAAVVPDLVVEGMTSRSVRMGGQRVVIGGHHEGFRLRAVDVPAGVALFERGDDLWVWRRGRGGARLGERGAVAAVAARLAAERGLDGRREP